MCRSMDFGNDPAYVRSVLCRESIFGASKSAAAAGRAMKAFPPRRNRVSDVKLFPAYEAALKIGLDPPKDRKTRCRFARMSEAAAWTAGPLARLHALLKSRYRFVPYDEFLERVHAIADSLGRALVRAKPGRVGMYVLDRGSGEPGYDKSNVWVLFLMTRRLAETNPAAFARLRSAVACSPGKTGGLAVLLHVDDALYSGEQMVNAAMEEYACEDKAHQTLICVPFATSFAAASLRKLARHAGMTLIGRPEAIPCAFDGPGMTVAKYLRTVPQKFRGVRQFSCTTVFEHKVADTLSLPPVFDKGSPACTVQWNKPETSEYGRLTCKPGMDVRLKPLGPETKLPAMPPLFRFGACREGHYRALLKEAFRKLAEA
jgi:hypothetical protein